MTASLITTKIGCRCLVPVCVDDPGARVTCGGRALVTADMGNDPPQNGRGLSQAWVRGPVAHWLTPYRLDREAAGEMDIEDGEVFIGTGRR